MGQCLVFKGVGWGEVGSLGARRLSPQREPLSLAGPPPPLSATVATRRGQKNISPITHTRAAWLQEVTHAMLDLFCASAWWAQYCLASDLPPAGQPGAPAFFTLLLASSRGAVAKLAAEPPHRFAQGASKNCERAGRRRGLGRGAVVRALAVDVHAPVVRSGKEARAHTILFGGASLPKSRSLHPCPTTGAGRDLKVVTAEVWGTCITVANTHLELRHLAKAQVRLRASGRR